MLIINPGAPDASLVALDKSTGKEIWRTPGNPPGYSAFIAGTFGGKEQVVGYDSISLGGWEPETGKRLWTISPDEEGDFNVPTPIDLGDRILVSTENNGTRIYSFDSNGGVCERPQHRSGALKPDTSTPVVINDIALGIDTGLKALNVNDALKTLWQHEEESFSQYASLIAGNNRFLVLSLDGTLMLIKADNANFECISKVDLFSDYKEEADPGIWAHPALCGSRLYVRTSLGIYCFLLKE
jgi:outer membrane protein assembly factor BamB